MNPTTINDYIKAGLFLIPIPPVNGKPVKGPQGPNAIGWNLPRTAGNPNGYSRDLDNLIKRTRAPGSSIGLALEPSRIAAIDLDDLEAAREALALADIDLDVLMSDPQAVRIESRPGRGKLLYRVPEGFDCCSTKLVFGEKGKDERAVFEIRYKGSNGKTLQDVLPPSIHQDTGQPYQLVGDITKIPPLPQALADLWRRWEATDSGVYPITNPPCPNCGSIAAATEWWPVVVIEDREVLKQFQSAGLAAVDHFLRPGG